MYWDGKLALKKSSPVEKKTELRQLLQFSLEKSEAALETIGALHGMRIGLTPNETKEYLEGFSYRLGERERGAMEVFRKLFDEVAVSV